MNTMRKKYYSGEQVFDIISECNYRTLIELLNKFAEVPSADVQEVKHGKWVDIKIPANYSNEVQYQSAKCSVCKRYHTTPYLYMYYEHNYCPNCGARMDG